MTASPRPTVPQIRSETVILAVIVALALLAFGYLLSQRQQELRSSPIGLNGLQLWLTAEGGSAQGFSGGWNIDPVGIGLLVLPLHDTQPDRDLDPAGSKEELLVQQDEIDLSWYVIDTKLAQTPTLVVLPKCPPRSSG